MFIQHGQ